MKIADRNYKILNELETLNVPDCFVIGKHKLGNGHGERKFYVSNKDTMNVFFGWQKDCPDDKSQKATCFFLKEDIVLYLDIMSKEFKNPKLPYDKATKKFLKNENFETELELLPDNELIEFVIFPQNRLNGERGYVNSIVSSTTNKKEFSKWDGYDKFRKFLLPIISSVQIYQLEDVETHDKKFYWRPYPDFESMANINRLLVLFYSEEKFKDPEEKEKLLEKYRKKASTAENRRRTGQFKYRHALIEDFKKCPVTHIEEPNLLIASHIKPWAVCEDKLEKYNPNNGLLLSPLIDKLFDKGYITFNQYGKIVISPLLNEHDKERISLNTEKVYLENIKLHGRIEFLNYHQKYVFRGKFEE